MGNYSAKLAKLGDTQTLSTALVFGIWRKLNASAIFRRRL